MKNGTMIPSSTALIVRYTESETHNLDPQVFEMDIPSERNLEEALECIRTEMNNRATKFFYGAAHALSEGYQAQTANPTPVKSDVGIMKGFWTKVKSFSLSPIIGIAGIAAFSLAMLKLKSYFDPNIRKEIMKAINTGDLNKFQQLIGTLTIEQLNAVPGNDLRELSYLHQALLTDENFAWEIIRLRNNLQPHANNGPMYNYSIDYKLTPETDIDLIYTAMVMKKEEIALKFLAGKTYTSLIKYFNLAHALNLKKIEIMIFIECVGKSAEFDKIADLLTEDYFLNKAEDYLHRLARTNDSGRDIKTFLDAARRFKGIKLIRRMIKLLRDYDHSWKHLLVLYFIENNEIALALELIQNGLNDFSGVENDLVLHAAVISGNMQLLDVLLLHTDKLEKKNPQRDTPLILSRQIKNNPMAIRLIQKGAQIENFHTIGEWFNTEQVDVIKAVLDRKDLPQVIYEQMLTWQNCNNIVVLQCMLNHPDFETRFLPIVHLFKGSMRIAEAMRNMEAKEFGKAFLLFDSIQEGEVLSHEYKRAKRECGHLVLSQLEKEPSEGDEEYLARKHEIVLDYLVDSRDKFLIRALILHKYMDELTAAKRQEEQEKQNSQKTPAPEKPPHVVKWKKFKLHSS